jgi:hypothetical protein
MADDLEALRDVLQLLGDIFAEATKVAAAIGAAVFARRVRDNFARKMLGQRFARRSGLGFGLRRDCLDTGLYFGPCRLQLFQVQFELFNLDCNLLAPGAEHHPLELLDDKLQMLNLLGVGKKLLRLFHNCLALAIKLGFKSCLLCRESCLLCVARCQLSAMPNKQRHQCFSIERIKVRQRSDNHARSMP